MRRIGGIVMVLLAAIIGIVEFRALVDSTVVADLASRFAEHDPFPRLPWDMHVIFIMAFFFFLGVGLSFIFTRMDVEYLVSNHAMERTADRRENLFSMIETSHFEATAAPVSGRSSCSR